MNATSDDGPVGLPEVDGADDDSQDHGDDKMPGLE
jgi:hypothetical protein